MPKKEPEVMGTLPNEEIIEQMETLMNASFQHGGAVRHFLEAQAEMAAASALVHQEYAKFRALVDKPAPGKLN